VAGRSTLKLRSPDFRRVLGTCRTDLMAECKMVERSDSVETGCRRVDTYSGALSVVVKF